MEGNLTAASTATVGNRLVGDLDELHVRDSAPSTFSIVEDYTVGGSTLALWHFDEPGAASTAEDAGPDNLDGSMAGTMSIVSYAGEEGIADYDQVFVYDKVGNRTSHWTRAGNVAGRWAASYDDLNQLTVRSWQPWNDLRWLYSYDLNGNLTDATKEVKSGPNWVQDERWEYEWNPRDQMTKATKFDDNDQYAGKVEYRYCLSCDGARSERIEYDTSDPDEIVSWKRYEMDGLHVLRIDERYDSNSSGTITDADGWRTVEKNTNLPGDLAHLVAKSSYTYTSQTTSTGTATDYYYGYDPVGNLVAVSDDQGARAFDFSQDAFGNELSVGAFARDAWSTARAAGVYEHQTGKELDPFTGLYYFHARWYDPEVGRFVGRDPVREIGGTVYTLGKNQPTKYSDPTGKCTDCRYPPGGSNCNYPASLRDITLGPCHCHLESIHDWSLGVLDWFNDWGAIFDIPGNQNRSNAMRHCVWQCTLTYHCGTFLAWLVAQGHEYEHPKDDPDRIADEWNNQVGREIGRNVKCPHECYSKCRKALDSGDLAFR